MRGRIGNLIRVQSPRTLRNPCRGRRKLPPFMQRATQKEEISKKEVAVIPDGNFSSSSIIKKCVVIMEGDPNPGSIRGRMSFRSFNPSIDKLNGEAANPSQPENQGGRMPDRDNGSGQKEDESLKVGSPSNDANGNHKRKQEEISFETQFPNKPQKRVEDDEGSSSKKNRSCHQPKRQKLDWNVLRPPKRGSKKRG